MRLDSGDAVSPSLLAPRDRLVVATETSARMRLLALLPGLMMGAWSIWSFSYDFAGIRQFGLADDAFISMGYAKTLAESGELVWFPGAERVEGFTNPLQTLVMTVPHLLFGGGQAPVLFISLFGLACVLGTAYLAGGLAISLADSRILAVAATVTVSLLPALLAWSLLGLEVGLLSLLVMGALSLALRARRLLYSTRSLALLGLVLGVGMLVRLDFAVAGAVIAVWIALDRSESMASLRVRLLLTLGPLLVAGAGISLVRYWYYGSWLPNTYDLKMGGTSVSLRVGRFLETPAVPVSLTIMLIVGGWVLHRYGKEAKGPLFLLVLTGLTQILYVAYVGGDAFAPDRFLAPAAVLATIVGLAGVAVALRRSWVVLTGALTGLAIAVLLLTSAAPTFSYRWWDSQITASDVLSVEYSKAVALRDATLQGATIAVFTAGYPGYFSERRLVDMLGKSDAMIANGPRRDVPYLPGHDKFDYVRSIVEQRPDLVASDIPVVDQGLLFPANSEERRAVASLYDRLCLSRADDDPVGFAVLVRRDSRLVDRSLLHECATAIASDPPARAR